MNNIDVFDRCTAYIFSELYARFPLTEDLIFADPDIEIFDDNDTEADIVNKLEIYRATIMWLISAGYLKADSISYDAAHDVVLSPQGLEILKLPSSLEPDGPSLGEKITESMRSGALEAAGSFAKSAITKGLALVVSSA